MPFSFCLCCRKLGQIKIILSFYSIIKSTSCEKKKKTRCWELKRRCWLLFCLLKTSGTKCKWFYFPVVEPYWNPNMRVPNAIYTPSQIIPISSQQIQAIYIFKDQSQVRVKKSWKHVFKHCWSSHTLQRYTIYHSSDFPHILCCCFYFLGFSQIVVCLMGFFPFRLLSLFNIFVLRITTCVLVLLSLLFLFFMWFGIGRNVSYPPKK